MYIKFNLVPSYLHNTWYYISLQENNTGMDFDIDVGDNYPPEDNHINDLEKFKLMFFVYNRWGYPNDINFNNLPLIIYMFENKLEVSRFLFQIENQYIQAKILLEKFFNDKFKFEILINDTENLEDQSITFDITTSIGSLYLNVLMYKSAIQDMKNSIIAYLDPTSGLRVNNIPGYHKDGRVICGHSKGCIYCAEGGKKMLFFCDHHETYPLSLDEYKIKIVLEKIKQIQCN